MTAITPFPFWWNLTRKLGFCGYLVTAVSCSLLSLRTRWRPARSGFTAALTTFAFIESLFCLDMVFEWRLKIHTVCVLALGRYQLYNGRRPFQEALLATLALSLLLAIGYTIRRFSPNKGRLTAILGVSISLTLWFVEIISMHETDAGLYHLTDGVMVIAYCWIVACCLTLAGVLLEARSAFRRL